MTDPVCSNKDHPATRNEPSRTPMRTPKATTHNVLVHPDGLCTSRAYYYYVHGIWARWSVAWHDFKAAREKARRRKGGTSTM